MCAWPKRSATTSRKSDNVLCAGCQAILLEAVPTTRHLGDGIKTKQIPKGWGKAVPLPWGQQVPDMR